MGLFPDARKIARVVPIYKKGDRSLVGSNHPIAIIPVNAKLFENIMKIQLLSHFKANNLFCESQHGSRIGHSTTTAFMRLAENILEAYEQGKSLALILCDLINEFHIESHSVLLTKIMQY